jgi:hypothetical protein
MEMAKPQAFFAFSKGGGSEGCGDEQGGEGGESFFS